MTTPLIGILTKFHIDGTKIIDVIPFSISESVSFFMIQTLGNEQTGRYFIAGLKKFQNQNRIIQILT